jgi:hypothetical protein
MLRFYMTNTLIKENFNLERPGQRPVWSPRGSAPGCRGLVLLEPRSKVLHELIADLGSQRRNMLMDLRLHAS